MESILKGTNWNGIFEKYNLNYSKIKELLEEATNFHHVSSINKWRINFNERHSKQYKNDFNKITVQQVISHTIVTKEFLKHPKPIGETVKEPVKLTLNKKYLEKTHS